MQRKYRLMRVDAYREGLETFDELAREASFRDFVCLYIAEGSKRERNSVGICNSDPAVLELSTRWIRQMTDKELEFSIQYHADQGTAELRRFWGQVLEIDTDRIRLQRKSNSSQLRGRQWRCRYGVLTVRAHDTVLRQRMQAWMHLLRASWR